MDITYGISELFSLAFGVKSPVFIPYPIQINGHNDISYKLPEAQSTDQVTYSGVQVSSDREVTRTSWMGTPIVFPWSLNGGTYKVFNPVGELVDYQIDDFEMPAATLLNFEREKIITRTRISAAQSTVKEMYGFDDWECRVRGICLTDNSRRTAKTADEQKQALLKWERICTAVKVSGDLFFEKDIMALSIGKITFTQLEGKPDVIPFEFQAYSDERLELVL